MRKLRDYLKRYIANPLEAVVLAVAFGVFRMLPLRTASGMGGWLARSLGPRLIVSERALTNLSRAFPNMTPDEREAVLSDMWENLGRTVAEYPHVHKIDVFDPTGPVEVIGKQYLEALRDDGKPGIFLAAHLGNWELTSRVSAQIGLPVDTVYRRANNPLTEWLYGWRSQANGIFYPKGAEGARGLLKSLSEGRHVGMLVDQKMNDGIAVPFFGHDAMTAPAAAQLALKFECPVVPVKVERLKGCTFRIIFSPPLAFTPSGDRHQDVNSFMVMVNQVVEDWIREKPAQWLWLHRRWPND